MPKTYFIQTFGCQQNENDSEILAGQLELMGYLPTTRREEADVILINTCSVRENADDRFFGHLGRLKGIKKARPDVFVGVGGCILTQPQNAEKVARSYPFVDLVFGTADLGRFPDLFRRARASRRTLIDVGPADHIDENLPVVRQKTHRALVSVMFGCNNFCTYCIVPYTRGRERSRQLMQVLNEVKEAAAAGHPEIMLLGQNVNAWGKDLDYVDGDFADLLEAVAAIPGVELIRFMTSHPKDLSPRLIDAIGRLKTVEAHVHLPLQSGSNQVLKRMNRRYTKEKYLDLVAALQAVRPGIAISTDIIVGFPGESDEDFQETLDVVRRVRYSYAFTYIYSQRAGTPAAGYGDTVDAEIIGRRYKALTDLQYAIQKEDNENLVGQELSVLVEGPSQTNKEVLTARSRDNRLVHIQLPDRSLQADRSLEQPATRQVPDFKELTGRFIRVRVNQAGSFALLAELEAWS